jgi:hypothetical protein
MHKHNIGVHLQNDCGSGKVISITYSDCMSVALGIQHTKRMRHIIVSFVACVVSPSFSTLSHTRHDIRKQLLNIQYVFLFSLQLLFETFLILRKIQRDIIINVLRCSCKVLIILVRFYFVCIQPCTGWEWFHYHSNGVPALRFVISKCCIWRIFRSTKHLH